MDITTVESRWLAEKEAGDSAVYEVAGQLVCVHDSSMTQSALDQSFERLYKTVSLPSALTHTLILHYSRFQVTKT